MLSFLLAPTRAADTRYGKRALAGGCGGSGWGAAALPPCPPWLKPLPERSRSEAEAE
jgi:hypothetical protein